MHEERSFLEYKFLTFNVKLLFGTILNRSKKPSTPFTYYSTPQNTSNQVKLDLI